MTIEEVLEDDVELELEGFAEVEGLPEIEGGEGVTLGACADPSVEGWGLTPGNKTAVVVGAALS